MTSAQKGCRFVSVLATLLAAVWLFDVFSTIHQGEQDHPVGFAIVWGGQIGAIGLIVTAGLAAVAPKAALKAMIASAAIATPMVATFLFPSLWCLFLTCSTNFVGVFWQPVALVPVIALAVAIATMHFSRP